MSGIARWLVVCAASVAFVPPSSGSSTATSASADHTTEGRLLARAGGARIDIPLEHTDVKLRVDGDLVDATVTQRFRNPYATKIEALYLFPLPTGAAVTALAIDNGGHHIVGTIAERARATAIYEAARAQGKVAALLTEQRPNLFTQAIANLEPNATIDVTLRYVERLHYDDGGYELVFPMVAGPRYVPSAASTTAPAPASDRVQPAVLPPGVHSSHDIAVHVDLAAGVALEAVASPSHQVVIARPDDRHAQIELSPTDAIPNKDFVLRYRVAGVAAKFGAVAYRPEAGDGEGSFVFTAIPPVPSNLPFVPAVAPVPRELIVLLDTSSSMRGAPLAKAKELVRRLLADLGPDDTYQIVRFDDRASALGPAPIANHARNVQLTLDWLAQVQAGGTTEMTTGIAAAFAVPHDPARLRLVAFVGDGYIGNEDDVLAQVAAQRGPARVFAFGVGTAVNRYLLEELAAHGRGQAWTVRPDEDAAAAIGQFEARIAAALVTDIAIDWGGLAVRDVTPRELPDLFAGQPLALSGHYDHGGAAIVTVRGHTARRDVAFRVPVELPERAPDHAAIATVWARERIAELSRQLVRKADPAIEREITALSLAHHVLTRFTAFVAVDDSRITSGGPGKRVVVPVEVPDRVAEIADGSATIYGYGGFGVGGGGAGYGVIGIGSYGTIGSGAGGMGVLASVHVHVAAAPIVMIGAPQVVGSLDKAIIRRYVRRASPQITHCYEQRLIAKPKLAGTVEVAFTIAPSGKVNAVTTSGLADDEIRSCIAKVVEDLEFPSVSGGGNVVVNYPFELHPVNGEHAASDLASPKESP